MHKWPKLYITIDAMSEFYDAVYGHFVTLYYHPDNILCVDWTVCVLLLAS